MAAAFNQYKVPALLPILMQSFGVDLADAGWLVSAFSVTGVLLALPSGLILHRLGSRTTGIAGLGFVLAGCLMGSAPLGIDMFLASRVVEGVGLGLVVVVSPALIAEWFPPGCRGLPMGIYAIWLPVGAVLAFSVAPSLAGVGGWELAWWAGAAVSLVAMVVYVAVIHSGRPLLDADRTDSALDLRLFFSNRDIWLLSAAFTCACIAMGVVPSFYATYLVTERGWDLGPAAAMTSLRMAAFLISCPLAGVVADRIGSWKLVYTVPALCTTALWLVMFDISGWQIPAFMIVTGLLGGAFPTAAFSAVPELMRDPRLVGVGMAILTLGLAVSNVVGPLAFGYMVGVIGWTGAGDAMIPITLIGVVAGVLVRVR